MPQPSTSPVEPSAGKVHQRHRWCNGCGLKLNVTYLLPGRPYRCHACGTVFRLHPMLEESTSKPFKPPHTVLRLALVSLISGALVWIAAWLSELVIARENLIAVAGMTALFTAAGSILIRRQSLDAIGIAGVMLTMAGLGTAASLALGHLPAGPKSQSAMFMIIGWLVVGATALAQFWRRMGLPNVGTAGLLRPDEL